MLNAFISDLVLCMKTLKCREVQSARLGLRSQPREPDVESLALAPHESYIHKHIGQMMALYLPHIPLGLQGVPGRVCCSLSSLLLCSVLVLPSLSA